MIEFDSVFPEDVRVTLDAAREFDNSGWEFKIPTPTEAASAMEIINDEIVVGDATEWKAAVEVSKQNKIIGNYTILNDEDGNRRFAFYLCTGISGRVKVDYWAVNTSDGIDLAKMARGLSQYSTVVSVDDALTDDDIEYIEECMEIMQRECDQDEANAKQAALTAYIKRRRDEFRQRRFN